METLTTRDIKVSIETFYQANYSKPLEHKYIHAYRVTIENKGQATVQLQRRHWIINDSNGVVREVEGEGVIGQQPIIHPGATHQYVSWCHLSTDMGMMSGSYQMFDTINKFQFNVRIPEFKLIAPFKLN